MPGVMSGPNVGRTPRRAAPCRGLGHDRFRALGTPFPQSSHFGKVASCLMRVRGVTTRPAVLGGEAGARCEVGSRGSTNGYLATIYGTEVVQEAPIGMNLYGATINLIGFDRHFKPSINCLHWK